LQNLGFIHSDLKINNFMMKKNRNLNDLYIFNQQENRFDCTSEEIINLIDFGLSKQILNDDNKIIIKNVKYSEGNSFFMSIRMHQKKPQGMRDDLESLLYSMIFILEGDTPWSIVDELTYEQIIKKKVEYMKTCRANIQQFLINNCP
jgi:serine/threonine protein kinase